MRTKNFIYSFENFEADACRCKRETPEIRSFNIVSCKEGGGDVNRNAKINVCRTRGIYFRVIFRTQYVFAYDMRVRDDRRIYHGQRGSGGVEEAPCSLLGIPEMCFFIETAANKNSAVPVKRFAARRVVFDFELGVPMTDDRRPAALVFEPQHHVRPVIRSVVRVLSAGGRHGFQQLYRQTVVVAAAYVAR